MHALHAILMLLAASVVGVALFRRLHLPPVLAYLVVGVLLGPSGAGLIADTVDVRLLAEFGVVFLLFSIGLEFSFPQLRAMRWTVLGLGGAQMVITTAAVAAIAWLAGATAAAAVVVGGALALSSTAVVTRQLTEQLEMHARHGRRAMGVLLFQDLSAVPLLILIPVLAGDTDVGLWAALGLAVVKGALVFLLMAWIGRRALRPLFHEVAASRSNELFTLAVLLVAISAAWVTHLAGLSLVLGAFLAGIMLGETEFRHQIAADIRPFRDLLLGLFFVTIGMLLDLSVLADTWPWVLLVLAGMTVFKAALIWALTRLAGEDRRVAVRTGLVLAQGGEFGFALLSLAMAAAVVPPVMAQVALAAVVLSMGLAPVLIGHNAAIADRISRAGYAARGRGAERVVSAISRDLEGHVLLCGYGRTGQNIARFLEQEGFAYAALDLDPARVQEAATAGESVSFGDASRREILAAAGLARARMMVVSFEDPAATLKVLAHARAQRPDMPVLVRTRDDVWIERFQQAGATAVVPEVLEASLMLTSHVLVLLEVPASRVFRYVRNVRADRYRLLRGYFHGEERLDLEKADRFREQLHTVTLPEDAHAVGRPLAAIRLEEIEVSVTAVRRGGIRGPQPDPATRLTAGDVLVLYGRPERLEQAEARLLSGPG